MPYYFRMGIGLWVVLIVLLGLGSLIFMEIRAYSIGTADPKILAPEKASRTTTIFKKALGILALIGLVCAVGIIFTSHEIFKIGLALCAALVIVLGIHTSYATTISSTLQDVLSENPRMRSNLATGRMRPLVLLFLGPIPVLGLIYLYSLMQKTPSVKGLWGALGLFVFLLAAFFIFQRTLINALAIFSHVELENSDRGIRARVSLFGRLPLLDRFVPREEAAKLLIRVYGYRGSRFTDRHFTAGRSELCVETRSGRLLPLAFLEKPVHKKDGLDAWIHPVLLQTAEESARALDVPLEKTTVRKKVLFNLVLPRKESS